MYIKEDAITDGLNAAYRRTRTHFDVVPDRLRDFQSPLINVLEKWPDEAHPRFVSLFVELWAVAESARLVNKEPRLTEVQIYEFLEKSSAYFNSFFHK